MKILLSFLTIILSLNSSICYGIKPGDTFDVISIGKPQEYPDPSPIEMGNQAPFNGLLFSYGKSNDIRKELLDADTNKLLVDSYKKSLDLFTVREQNYNTQIDLMIDSNKKLSEQNSSLRNQADFNKYIYFGLGILVTGISIYAAKKLTDSSK